MELKGRQEVTGVAEVEEEAMDNIVARVEIFLGAEAAEADRQHLLKVAEVEVSGEAVGEVATLPLQEGNLSREGINENLI